MNSMLEPGLSSLLSQAERGPFFENNWSHSFFVSHQNEGLRKSFVDRPHFSSLDSLLGSWTGQCQAHLPDKSDEVSAVDATPADAKKLFNCGMSLLFNNVENQDPALKVWISKIQSDLGLPAMTYGRCMVYATPDGRGTSAHFDQNINFVLQLHGTKHWRLASNESVVNPLERHTLGLPVAAEMQAYASGPMPSTMPTDATEVVLKPGSLLFVPRGYWHQTKAEGDALALNFTFNQPSWIDLFTVALKSRLSLSPAWRELADGVSSSAPERREVAESIFEELLHELKEDLPNWRAADILGATEGR